MDYFRVRLEHAEEFTEREVQGIFNHMKENKLLNEDALRCFGLITNGLQIHLQTDENDFEVKFRNNRQKWFYLLFILLVY